MARYKATVSYLGADYCGWQSQPHQKSIQGEIEKALYKVTRKPITIVASGRTDAKVSAIGQVFHFDSELSIDYQRVLNAYLPDDIYISEVIRVSNRFHARFSAASKTYRYQIYTGLYDVFKKNTYYYLPHEVCVEKMREASKCFLGYHDFGSFCENSYDTHPDQHRLMTAIEIVQQEDTITFMMTGKGFLRYMVRMLVASLLAVGKGQYTIEDIELMLSHPDKQAMKKNVPAQGLTLMQVTYDRIVYLDEMYVIKTVGEAYYGVFYRHAKEQIGLYVYRQNELIWVEGIQISLEILEKAIENIQGELF